MDKLNAKPALLKRANLSLIRKVIKAKGTATRAEIASETKISSTTVRALLTEMMQNGEIKSIGYDESSGGRKAERYGFRTDRYYGAVFCISDGEIHVLLINTCAEILEIRKLEINHPVTQEPEKTGAEMEGPVFALLDRLVSEKEIKSIGIGVPGIVEGGGYLRKNGADGELFRVDIGEKIMERYRVPVVLENDLNATITGFARCYQKKFPGEKTEDIDMAYLYFEKGCVSAGFIAGGRIIRGSNNYAGELGLIPAGNGRRVDVCLTEAADDKEYIHLVTQMICWICGILNPAYVALCGPDLRENCIGGIVTEAGALLPGRMSAEILYSDDMWHDYYEGMAFLTAEKMFDDIQFVKE